MSTDDSLAEHLWDLADNSAVPGESRNRVEPLAPESSLPTLFATQKEIGLAPLPSCSLVTQDPTSEANTQRRTQHFTESTMPMSQHALSVALRSHEPTPNQAPLTTTNDVFTEQTEFSPPVEDDSCYTEQQPLPPNYIPAYQPIDSLGFNVNTPFPQDGESQHHPISIFATATSDEPSNQNQENTQNSPRGDAAPPTTISLTTSLSSRGSSIPQTYDIFECSERLLQPKHSASPTSTSASRKIDSIGGAENVEPMETQQEREEEYSQDLGASPPFEPEPPKPVHQTSLDSALPASTGGTFPSTSSTNISSDLFGPSLLQHHRYTVSALPPPPPLQTPTISAQSLPAPPKAAATAEILIPPTPPSLSITQSSLGGLPQFVMPTPSTIITCQSTSSVSTHVTAQFVPPTPSLTLTTLSGGQQQSGTGVPETPTISATSDQIPLNSAGAPTAAISDNETEIEGVENGGVAVAAENRLIIQPSPLDTSIYTDAHSHNSDDGSIMSDDACVFETPPSSPPIFHPLKKSPDSHTQTTKPKPTSHDLGQPSPIIIDLSSNSCTEFSQVPPPIAPQNPDFDFDFRSQNPLHPSSQGSVIDLVSSCEEVNSQLQNPPQNYTNSLSLSAEIRSRKPPLEISVAGASQPQKPLNNSSAAANNGNSTTDDWIGIQRPPKSDSAVAEFPFASPGEHGLYMTPPFNILQSDSPPNKEVSSQNEKKNSTFPQELSISEQTVTAPPPHLLLTIDGGSVSKTSVVSVSGDGVPSEQIRTPTLSSTTQPTEKSISIPGFEPSTLGSSQTGDLPPLPQSEEEEEEEKTSEEKQQPWKKRMPKQPTFTQTKLSFGTPITKKGKQNISSIASSPQINSAPIPPTPPPSSGPLPPQTPTPLPTPPDDQSLFSASTLSSQTSQSKSDFVISPTLGDSISPRAVGEKMSVENENENNRQVEIEIGGGELTRKEEEQEARMRGIVSHSENMFFDEDLSPISTSCNTKPQQFPFSPNLLESPQEQANSAAENEKEKSTLHEDSTMTQIFSADLGSSLQDSNKHEILLSSSFLQKEVADESKISPENLGVSSKKRSAEEDPPLDLQSAPKMKRVSFAEKVECIEFFPMSSQPSQQSTPPCVLDDDDIDQNQTQSTSTSFPNSNLLQSPTSPSRLPSVGGAESSTPLTLDDVIRQQAENYGDLEFSLAQPDIVVKKSLQQDSVGKKRKQQESSREDYMNSSQKNLTSPPANSKIRKTVVAPSPKSSPSVKKRAARKSPRQQKKTFSQEDTNSSREDSNSKLQDMEILQDSDLLLMENPTNTPSQELDFGPTVLPLSSQPQPQISTENPTVEISTENHQPPPPAVCLTLTLHSSSSLPDHVSPTPSSAEESCNNASEPLQITEIQPKISDISIPPSQENDFSQSTPLPMTSSLLQPSPREDFMFPREEFSENTHVQSSPLEDVSSSIDPYENWVVQSHSAPPVLDLGLFLPKHENSSTKISPTTTKSKIRVLTDSMQPSFLEDSQNSLTLQESVFVPNSQPSQLSADPNPVKPNLPISPPSPVFPELSSPTSTSSKRMTRSRSKISKDVEPNQQTLTQMEFGTPTRSGGNKKGSPQKVKVKEEILSPRTPSQMGSPAKTPTRRSKKKHDEDEVWWDEMSGCALCGIDTHSHTVEVKIPKSCNLAKILGTITESNFVSTENLHAKSRDSQEDSDPVEFVRKKANFSEMSCDRFSDLYFLSHLTDEKQRKERKEQLETVAEDIELPEPSDFSEFLGDLVGPFKDAKWSHAAHVHEACAVWSPEVYTAPNGALQDVVKAINRGRRLRCVMCNHVGATLGCSVETCPRAYHFLCATFAGCDFCNEKFSVLCPEHKPKEEEKSAAAPRAKKKKSNPKRK